MVSIYSLDGSEPVSPPSSEDDDSEPAPTPPSPSPSSDDFELLGCSEDNVPRGNRVGVEPRRRENVKSR